MIAYGFTAGQDFSPISGNINGAGQDFDRKNLIGQDKLGRKRETHNHIISLDMAKEISMIQRTGLSDCPATRSTARIMEGAGL